MHTFVFSCGKTTQGRPQAHSEEIDENGMRGPKRKCPEVLNRWTAIQPIIDKGNRWRQRILAIEERFPTHSYPFRQLTTLVGVIFVNAYRIYERFIKVDQFEFLEFIKEASYGGLHNTYDMDHDPHYSAPLPMPPSPPPRQSPRTAQKKHFPVPISSIIGWKGKKQQTCSVCRVQHAPTGFCCVECSSADAIFPMHPPSVKYGKCASEHACTRLHAQNPKNPRHRFCSHRPPAAIRKPQRAGGRGGRGGRGAGAKTKGHGHGRARN